ncbi:MAG TPA: hypothetical protein VHL79_08845 [Ramlibacter sp.]|jgi:hypothetical protein|nr:hypothetical protein [Ramlibacter sp.]
MLHTVTVRALALAACGWLLAADALALSVGRARGAALIGRPLDLSIPVTLDAPDADGACARAEVFYGEQKVTAPPTVRWEPGRGNEGVLRVSAPAPVDEPMVTVYLHVGCAQSTTRRFVLLSEVPPANETSLPGTRSAPVPAAPPAQAQAQPATPPRAAPAAPPAAAVPRRGDVAAAAPTLRPETQIGERRQPARAAPPPPAQREPRETLARLRLEPLDLSVERSPTLRMSSQLGAEPGAESPQRAAAAALWLALQKTPDEALQDAIRLQAVQREMDALRDVTRQNAAAVGELRSQVERARGDRNLAAAMALALGALLAALLAWFAWRWYRVHQLDRVGRWFDAHGDTGKAPLAGSEPVSAAPPTEPDFPLDAPSGPATKGKAAAAAAAVAAVARNDAARAGVNTSGWSNSDFQASRGGSVRMVGVEELIDVHDKADFFLSIGEHEQAIAVLEAHVHDQVETSALPWMDLLELYHSLGKRMEYERLRSEFRQRFTAQVPDFEHFDQPTASLENYSRALSRIVALWPTRRVLDVIEESIFRQPGLPGAEAFSLEAYRELVLLYHVAKEVSPPAEGAPDSRPGTFSDTSLQPLNMLDESGSQSGDLDLLLIPPASANLGLDIDLGDIGDSGGSAERKRAGQPPAPSAFAMDATQADRDLPPLDFDISSFGDDKGKRSS